jgi:hypothetical protein
MPGTGPRTLLLCATIVLVTFANAENPSDSVKAEPDLTGDRPTPAQSALLEGVNQRRQEAAIEKADSAHQAEMKKCEGLTWEEAKLCKDQVSKETAQTQEKAQRDREERTPPSP